MQKRFWIAAMAALASLTGQAQTIEEIKDLSAFRNPGPSWQLAGGVYANPDRGGAFAVTPGRSVLVHLPGKRKAGTDLYTRSEYGDMDLELEYQLARGSTSGIWLQGRYEVRLSDSWGTRHLTANDNGGISGYGNAAGPSGGFGGRPPRLNASRAPGLWQTIKIAFRAPRFDATGRKIRDAVIEEVTLNGTLVQENVILPGPARGSEPEEEAALGPLRFLGSQGAVAFRNIRVVRYGPEGKPKADVGGRPPAPIYVNADANTTLRSFMDIPGEKRLVHALSAGSKEQAHYTYDLDNGSLFQVWRGGFLDATPMWHSRGDGSSRPRTHPVFLGSPVPSVAQLESPQADWPSDTSGSGFKCLGYLMGTENEPVFRYRTWGVEITDAPQALDQGIGIARKITVKRTQQDDVPLYHLVARAGQIRKIGPGLYLIGDNVWYVRVGGRAKPILRRKDGALELLLPLNKEISYSILF